MVGCPTISQVWDIKNLFYSSGASDEVFIKTKAKSQKSTVRLTFQSYKGYPEKIQRKKSEISILTFLALKQPFTDI